MTVSLSTPPLYACSVNTRLASLLPVCVCMCVWWGGWGCKHGSSSAPARTHALSLQSHTRTHAHTHAHTEVEVVTFYVSNALFVYAFIRRAHLMGFEFALRFCRLPPRARVTVAALDTRGFRLAVKTRASFT